jgi:hypothetical protein
MSETINTLVNAIAAGDALETENAFSAAMAQHVSARLDDMRMNVAQSMFKTEVAPEEVSEE